MVRLARCVEVVRFSCSRLGLWWGLHAMAGLVCGRLAPWWDLHAALGWHHGEVFIGWVDVEVRLAHHVGMASKQYHSKSCTPQQGGASRLACGEGGRWGSWLVCSEVAAVGTCEA